MPPRRPMWVACPCSNASFPHEPSKLIAVSLTESRWLRFASFTAFYYAQGIPIGLLTIAVPAWLAEHGVGLVEIAAYQSVIGLPWGLKLFAGPFMDRFAFPAMGRRRPWVMSAQFGLTLSMASLMLVTDAATQIALLTAIAFAVNLFAAVQDVAVDGMAIDVLPPSERGRANALMAFGQVAGFSSFAALSGILLNSGGLSAAAVVGTIAIGAVLMLITLTRERRGERILPWTMGSATDREQPGETTFGGVIGGLLRVLFLPMSVLLVLVELLVRTRDGIAISIFPVFAVQSLHFSSVEYSSFQGYMGVPVALIGVLFGPLIDRFGIKRLYMLALLTSAGVTLTFAFTPFWWANTGYVIALWSIAALSNQMLFVAFIALAMNICWARVAATQFAVYMSLSNLSRSIGAAVFATIAGDLDSAESFVLISALMIGAAVALSFFDMDSHRMRLQELDTRSKAVPL
jgi:MFS transporter, PAT family, beta-lactamase induction signal transducer AmpG